MKIERFLKQSRLYKLHVAYRGIEANLGPTLKALDLNFTQALVLISIYFDGAGAVTPSQLVESLKISKSQLSHILSHLESMQFIRRTVDPADARRYRLKIRPERRSKVLSAVNAFERADRQADSLPPL